MNSRYHYFAGTLFSSLAEVSMQESIPLWASAPSAVARSMVDIATDWLLLIRPYVDSIEWFENRYRTRDERAMTKIFNNLTLSRQTLVKRGYQIKYDGRYPPLLDGGIYEITACILVGAKAKGRFPAGRMLRNAAGELYVL